MLLTLPILFIMFGAMRSVANVQLAESLLKIQNAVGDLTVSEAVRAALPALDSVVEPFQWIKNLWVADSPFTPPLPLSSGVLGTLGASLEGVVTTEQMTALKAFIDGDVYQSIVLPHYSATPLPNGNINLLVTNLTLYSAPNGFLILPLLSFVTQYLTTALNPSTQTQTTGKPGGGAVMKLMMPLFSVYICATSNAAFALYWVVSNVVAMIQQAAFNWYFNYQEKKEAKIQASGEPA